MNTTEIKLVELNQIELLTIEGGCGVCRNAGRLVRDLIIGWLFS